MRKLHLTGAALVLMLLTACAFFGVPTPETFNERLAVGYSSVTTVRQSTLNLLQAGKLTPDRARDIQDQADLVRDSLDAAKQLSDVDLTDANDRLTIALEGLNALEAYLRTKQ